MGDEKQLNFPGSIFAKAERASTIEDRKALVEDVRSLLAQLMTTVTLLADDRALKRMSALLDATVRTNYFRHGGTTPTQRSGGVPYISLKIAVRELRDVPRSRLLFEVWVRSSRMEGVHLRGADVARRSNRITS